MCIPLFIESAILLFVAFSADIFTAGYPFLPAILSFALLFSMGLQNSLVTRVSQSVVRTTHLTGLFTDLGIQLSQLFFKKAKAERSRLNRSIFLKLMIISCFFLGCIVGGFVYLRFELKTLLLPVGFISFCFMVRSFIIQVLLFKKKVQTPSLVPALFFYKKTN